MKSRRWDILPRTETPYGDARIKLAIPKFGWYCKACEVQQEGLLPLYCSKKKTREITDLLVNQVGDLLVKGMKESDISNALLSSVLTSRICQLCLIFSSVQDAGDECTIIMLMILNWEVLLTTLRDERPCRGIQIEN